MSFESQSGREKESIIGKYFPMIIVLAFLGGIIWLNLRDGSYFYGVGERDLSISKRVDDIIK